MPDRAAPREQLAARVAAVAASLWLGLVATLALVAAPTLFAMLERPLAGRQGR
jgi:hypothetical protein